MSYTIQGAIDELALRNRDPNKILVSQTGYLTLLDQACADFSARTRCLLEVAQPSVPGSSGEVAISEASIVATGSGTLLDIERVEYNRNSTGSEAWETLAATTYENLLALSYNDGWHSEVMPRFYAVQRLAQRPTGSGVALVAMLRYLYVYPRPSSPTTYTGPLSRLRVWYRRTHTPITSGTTLTTKFEFPQEWHEAVLTFCEWKFAARDGREQIAEARKMQYLQAVEDCGSTENLTKGDKNWRPSPGYRTMGWAPGLGRPIVGVR